MDWKSNQQEIFWREYWQGHWLSCDAASINADLRVWVRMLLVPWSLVIVVQFHMIRPDNCVLIISMFTALHKILCSPTRLACGPARTVGSRRICTVHDLRLDWEIMTYSFSVGIEESTLVLSYFQHTAKISALMTKTVPVTHTCDNMADWGVYSSYIFYCLYFVWTSV